MATLNLDCWHIVFEQLEPETRALYNCLFVSKEFFSLSTRVLYRRPLQVFEGQRELSPFSKNRLENLLGICTGFINTAVAASVVEEKQQQESPSSLSSSSTSTTTTTTTTTTSITGTKTTINYYKLVLEYPAHSNIQSKYESEWQQYVDCFAETVTHLFFIPQGFDAFLKLVTRCQSLKRIYVNIPSPSTESSTIITEMATTDEFLNKVLQFIRLHGQTFPGLLSALDTCTSLYPWKASVEVQEAMAGMAEQRIVIKQDVQQDLNGLVLSRLKTLTLNCFENAPGQETKAIELLKRCSVLETLNVGWTQGKVFDWSSLMIETNDDHHHKIGFVQQGNLQPLQHQQSRQQQTRFGLKHLSMWGNATVTLEVMKVFKETLESVNVGWNHKFPPSDSFVDWKKSFIMPKLKSIVLYQCNLGHENLICCPNLETLVLESIKNETPSTWSTFASLPPIISTTSVLPITLRHLSLKESSVDGFNLLWLKPLVNLEHLYIGEQVYNDYESMTMINMSKEKGWWFPRLRSVVAFEQSAVHIQGQILWIAPRLESLELHFRFWNGAGPLETDTFLFPPSTLDFETKLEMKYLNEKNVVENDLLVVNEMEPSETTVLKTTTISSMASFPTLKSLKLLKFQFTKSHSTAKAFGDAFFCPRPNETNVLKETKNSRGGDGIIGNKSFLFPNLEELELCWDQPHHYLRPCVFQAMRNMPKLERIRYTEWRSPSRFDVTMAEWLQPVPGDELGTEHADYRHQPEAVATTTTNGGIQANRCVVRFDHPLKIRYQLKAPI